MTRDHAVSTGLHNGARRCHVRFDKGPRSIGSGRIRKVLPGREEVTVLKLVTVIATLGLLTLAIYLASRAATEEAQEADDVGRWDDDGGASAPVEP